MDKKLQRDILNKLLNGRKLKYLGSGRNRKVYLLPGGKYVIKVPRNELGEGDNSWEVFHRNFKDAWSQTIKVNAKCRMIPGTWISIMEYVKPLSYAEIETLFGSVPEWIDCVDCGQVGMSRNNQLKVYDYGRH